MKVLLSNSRLVFVENGSISPQNVVLSKFINYDTLESEDNDKWQYAEFDVSNIQFLDLVITSPSASLYAKAKAVIKTIDGKTVGLESNLKEADKQYVFENIDVRLCERIYVNCKNGSEIKCVAKLYGQSDLIEPIVHENSSVSNVGVIGNSSYTDLYEYNVEGADAVRIASMCNASLNGYSHQAVAMKEGSFVKLIKWAVESDEPETEQINIVSTNDCDTLLVIARKPYASACMVL